MIASASFRNFRALRSASLALAPFNLLVGPNGSGKTSLISALLRLRALARLPLADASVESRAEGAEIIFQFQPPHAALTARLACSGEMVCDLLQVSPAGAPGLPALRADLARIRAYLFDHYAMARPAPVADGAEFAPNGANLAAVLAARRRDAPAAFASLEADLLRLLPEYRGIEFAETAPGEVELRLALADGEEPVSAENLSQGTLFLLGVLALAHDPAPPAVVCLEEIDRGIHPRMLRALRDALYRLAYPAAAGLARPPVQVVATTHSPYLLDLFRDHPDEVVITQKIGNAAHFERLSDRADLAELLREGSLGDMWFSGILGGVPAE